MKIYTGWELLIDDKVYVIAGSVKIRGVQSYVLRDIDGAKTSILRSSLLELINKGIIRIAAP